MVFRNNDLPGVVMCSALDRLMRLYGVAPSAPVVVLAGNDLAYRTAFSSQDGGANVAAIVDLRNTCNDTALSDEAKRRGIALFQGCGIYEAKRDSSIMDCRRSMCTLTSGRGSGKARQH